MYVRTIPFMIIDVLTDMSQLLKITDPTYLSFFSVTVYYVYHSQATTFKAQFVGFDLLE